MQQDSSVLPSTLFFTTKTRSGNSSFSHVVQVIARVRSSYYNRTRIKETRIKETFGYKKRFHNSAFMHDKLSMLIGRLIKETKDKRNFGLTAL